MKSLTKRRLVIAAVVATGILLFLLTAFDIPDRSSSSAPPYSEPGIDPTQDPLGRAESVPPPGR